MNCLKHFFFFVILHTKLHILRILKHNKFRTWWDLGQFPALVIHIDSILDNNQSREERNQTIALTLTDE